MHEATLFLKIIVVFRDCIQVLIKVMLRYLRLRKNWWEISRYAINWLDKHGMLFEFIYRRKINNVAWVF